jgi:hypothetical protein
MEIIDLNGTGDWSSSRTQERYAAYCAQLNVTHRALSPDEYRTDQRCYIFPIATDAVFRVTQGDPAAIALCVDLLEENHPFPWGSPLKPNAARALRRAALTDEQKARLRKRLVSMLIAGIIPHEFREYYKLLRTIGVAEYWPELHACVPRDNPVAMRFYSALVQNDPAARLTSS